MEADYGMDPRVWQSLDGLSFGLSSKLCLCSSFNGALLPIPIRGKVSTPWSSYKNIFSRGRGWGRGNYSGNNNNSNNDFQKRSQEEEWDPEYTPKSKKYYLVGVWD